MAAARDYGKELREAALSGDTEVVTNILAANPALLLAADDKRWNVGHHVINKLMETKSSEVRAKLAAMLSTLYLRESPIPEVVSGGLNQPNNAGISVRQILEAIKDRKQSANFEVAVAVRRFLNALSDKKAAATVGAAAGAGMEFPSEPISKIAAAAPAPLVATEAGVKGKAIAAASVVAPAAEAGFAGETLGAAAPVSAAAAGGAGGSAMDLGRIFRKAAFAGNLKVVATMLSANPHLLLSQGAESKKTALHQVIEGYLSGEHPKGEHMKVIQLLVHGYPADSANKIPEIKHTQPRSARISMQDKDGNTPGHVLVQAFARVGADEKKAQTLLQMLATIYLAVTYDECIKRQAAIKAAGEGVRDDPKLSAEDKVYELGNVARVIKEDRSIPADKKAVFEKVANGKGKTVGALLREIAAGAAPIAAKGADTFLFNHLHEPSRRAVGATPVLDFNFGTAAAGLEAMAAAAAAAAGPEYTAGSRCPAQ